MALKDTLDLIRKSRMPIYLGLTIFGRSHMKDVSVEAARILYFSLLAISVVVNLFLLKKINGIDDKKPVKTKSPQGETTTVTVREYDTKQVLDGLRSQLISVAIVCVLHFYKGMLPPMLLQGLMMPFGILDNKMFRIHVVGEHPSEDLARPFKAGGLMEMLQNMNPDNQVVTKGKKKDGEKAAASGEAREAPAGGAEAKGGAKKRKAKRAD
ncbi:unnamed protein product [Pedinophyceae sp. YPF-701]|nr:unnamed protein product [Pedinophyceae sp. YPF-701]